MAIVGNESPARSINLSRWGICFVQCDVSRSHFLYVLHVRTARVTNCLSPRIAIYPPRWGPVGRHTPRLCRHKRAKLNMSPSRRRLSSCKPFFNRPLRTAPLLLQMATRRRKKPHSPSHPLCGEGDHACLPSLP